MTAGAGGVVAYATIDELAAAFGLTEAQAAALSRYADLMLAWRRGNVTALRTRKEIVSTLFGDALALRFFFGFAFFPKFKKYRKIFYTTFCFFK